MQVIFMQLIPISKQKGANFRKHYLEWAENPNPNLAQAGRMMAELIEHLEDNVSAPDVWAFTSHTDLVLNDKDTWQTVLVTINALPRLAGPEGYEITYYVEPPWLCVTGYTNDVIVASEMIMEALKKAVPSETRLF